MAFFNLSSQGKEAAKSRHSSGKYLPSPESDINMFPSHANYTMSSKSSQSSHAHMETSEMLGTASYDLQMVCHNENVPDQSSPPFNSVTIMSSASSFSSRETEWIDVSKSGFSSHGCFRQLSGSSLRWRSSPITPRTNLGESQYMQCLESDSRLFDILEDDTPDVLMEASTPIKSGKANSPIQKRVSPLPGHVRRIVSSSSGGLRSGRKFILQSVPSFPPLTPCVDSKGNGNGNVNEDSGNCAKK